MVCNCGYQSETDFKQCPKCGRRVLTVFTEKTSKVYTRAQHNSDMVKGILVGLGVSVITNALIAGLVFGFSILLVGMFGMYNVYGFYLIVGSYALASIVLGYFYNKLYNNLGLSNNARIMANVSYFVIAISIFSLFL